MADIFCQGDTHITIKYDGYEHSVPVSKIFKEKVGNTGMAKVDVFDDHGVMVTVDFDSGTISDDIQVMVDGTFYQMTQIRYSVSHGGDCYHVLCEDNAV